MSDDIKTERVNRTTYSRTYKEQEIRELILRDLIERSKEPGTPAGKVDIRKEAEGGLGTSVVVAYATFSIDHLAVQAEEEIVREAR